MAELLLHPSMLEDTDNGSSDIKLKILWQEYSLVPGNNNKHLVKDYNGYRKLSDYLAAERAKECRHESEI